MAAELFTFTWCWNSLINVSDMVQRLRRTPMNKVEYGPLLKIGVRFLFLYILTYLLTYWHILDIFSGVTLHGTCHNSKAPSLYYVLREASSYHLQDSPTLQLLFSIMPSLLQLWCFCQWLFSVNRTVALIESCIFCQELSRGLSVRKSYTSLYCLFFPFSLSKAPPVFQNRFLGVRLPRTHFQKWCEIILYPLLTVLTHSNLIHATIILHLH